MAGSALLLSEADLHGLVDGHLPADRRGDVLRRLAASPEDRARVEAWQEQSDLIRNAFLGVDREPLPSQLDLVPPPRLFSIVGSAQPPRPLVPSPPGGRFARPAAGMAAFALVAIFVSGMLMPRDKSAPQATAVGLRGSIDATLAERAERALETTSPGPDTTAAASVKDHAMPTATIPDLGGAGFVFDGAETQEGTPYSLLFRYRNATAQRVVISVARLASGSSSGKPTPVGRSFGWHQGDTAFVMAGTVPRETLQSMADTLQADTLAE